MQRYQVYISLFLILVLWQTGHTQTTSPAGSFEVDYVRGCAPLTITVNNLVTTEVPRYFFDADTCDVSSAKYDAGICGALVRVANNTFTYDQPGTYTLIQLFNVALPRSDTLTIEVLEPQAPEFDVFLCRNNSVQVDITDTYYEQYEIDYGDGTPLTTSTTHTYATPGAYSISVTGQFLNSPNNCGSTTITANAINTLTPAVIDQIEVLQVDNGSGSVQLDFNLAPGISYTLEVSENGTGSFMGLGSVTGNSLVIANLDTQTNYYCYRIIASDICNNETNASNIVCSTQLLGTALENQNELAWRTDPVSFLNYEVSKASVLLPPAINNVSNQSFVDTNITCNQNVCYQVNTNYTNGSKSISAPICLQPISTLVPPTITNITATIEDGQISLTWDLPDPINFPLQSYALSRSTNGGAFELLARDSIMPYVDPAQVNANRYCYRISYQDACGNVSLESEPACAILLEGENIANTDFELDWTAYLGWEAGVREYQLELTDQDGNLIGSLIPFGPQTNSYLDAIDLNRQITIYRIRAISNDPVPLVSYSNRVFSDIPAQVFLPNAFSPNSDGLNDTFLAKGLFIDQFSLKIFSQWGELLFTSNQIELGWNGTYKGVLMPTSVYAYLVEISDPLGRQVTQRGTVHLVK